MRGGRGGQRARGRAGGGGGSGEKGRERVSGGGWEEGGETGGWCLWGESARRAGVGAEGEEWGCEAELTRRVGRSVEKCRGCDSPSRRAQVLRLISQREAVLTSLRRLLPSPRTSPQRRRSTRSLLLSPHHSSSLREQLAALLSTLRSLGVEICEAVRAWVESE